jgi:hypothetical protein
MGYIAVGITLRNTTIIGITEIDAIRISKRKFESLKFTRKAPQILSTGNRAKRRQNFACSVFREI